MTARSFRFANLGIVFLLSICYGIWLVDGDFSFKFLDEHYFNSIIVIISSIPIGWILSYIPSMIAHGIFGVRVDYQFPNENIERLYFDIIREKFPNFIIIDDNNRVQNWDNLYAAHQTLLRKPNHSVAIDFSTRRFDVFWTNINYGLAIFIGTIIGLIGWHRHINYEFDIWKILSLVALIIYVIFSIRHGFKARNEADNFEKIVLIQNPGND